MKKLILSMLIVLGTIVSTQAQFRSWNFSCGHEATNAPVVINLDGYSADQLATLDGLGFIEGTSQISGQPILVGTASGWNITISHVPAGINVDAGVIEGVRAGTYYFRASGGNGFTSLYAVTADEMIVIIQSLDLDGNGFSHGEEVLLASYVDNSNGPLFDMDTVNFTQIATDNYDGGYIIVASEGNGFRVYDEDENVYEFHTTFRSALDAAIAYANA